MIFSSRNFTLRHQEEQGHSKQHFAQPNIQCYHLQFQPSTKHWKTDTIQSRPLPTRMIFPPVSNNIPAGDYQAAEQAGVARLSWMNILMIFKNNVRTL